MTRRIMFDRWAYVRAVRLANEFSTSVNEILSALLYYQGFWNRAQKLRRYVGLILFTVRPTKIVMDIREPLDFPFDPELALLLVFHFTRYARIRTMVRKALKAQSSRN